MKCLISFFILISVSFQAKAFTDDCGTFSEKGILRLLGKQFVFFITKTPQPRLNSSWPNQSY